MGPTGAAGAGAPSYYAGTINGSNPGLAPTITSGTGFSVARQGVVGSYRITGNATASGRFLVTIASSTTPGRFAVVVLYSKDGSGKHIIDVELHTPDGAFVDGTFSFIAIDRS